MLHINREFGPKIMPLKPVVKQLQVLLEDRDKTVRDETKLLAVEIYRWIGPALKPQLANLKPVQVSDMDRLLNLHWPTPNLYR